MKKSIVLIPILFLSTVLTAFAQEGSGDVKPPTQEINKLIVIKGNEGWKNTGIEIRPTDKVIISAQGKVFFSAGSMQSEVTPDGLNQMQYKLKWSGDAELCDDPIKNVNHAALIAEVGKGTFMVGGSKRFNGKNGKLYLGINDCSLTGQYHNTGKFIVNIKITRKY